MLLNLTFQVFDLVLEILLFGCRLFCLSSPSKNLSQSVDVPVYCTPPVPSFVRLLGTASCGQDLTRHFLASVVVVELEEAATVVADALHPSVGRSLEAVSSSVRRELSLSRILFV